MPATTKPSILPLARSQKRHETTSIQTREVVPQNGESEESRIGDDHLWSVEFGFIRALKGTWRE